MSQRADCDALFKVVMPMARPLVDKFSEFYPFAMTMDRAGGIEGLSLDPPSDTPPVEEVWGALRASLSSLAAAGKLRAAAICVNTRITVGEKTRDAIAVFLEHEEGLALAVVVPYERAAEGRVTYEAPIARPSGPRSPGIFARVTH